MAGNRFDRLEEERQERILGAAAEEFAARGYESASLNRIVERAGESKGSLYYYFEDKTDLFSTVVERATARMLGLVGGFTLGSLTAETFWPTLDRLVRRSAEYLDSNAWYVKLARSFYRLRLESRGGGATVRVWGLVRRWTEDTIARGQELGVVRTDLPRVFLVEMTLALGEAADRWLLEHWEHLSPADRERMIQGEMGLFRRMLGV